MQDSQSFDQTYSVFPILNNIGASTRSDYKIQLQRILIIKHINDSHISGPRNYIQLDITNVHNNIGASTTTNYRNGIQRILTIKHIRGSYTSGPRNYSNIHIAISIAATKVAVPYTKNRDIGNNATTK